MARPSALRLVLLLVWRHSTIRAPIATGSTLHSWAGRQGAQEPASPKSACSTVIPGVRSRSLVMGEGCMGMCLALHSVSDRNIERILESPPLIWRLIAPDDPDIYLKCAKEDRRLSSRRRGLLPSPDYSRMIRARLLGRRQSAEDQEIPDLDLVAGEGVDEDLDKSWHGIHYCLNETATEATPPMDFITIGGNEAGQIDVGYGPARLFDRGTVREIARNISKITTEERQRKLQLCGDEETRHLPGYLGPGW